MKGRQKACSMIGSVENKERAVKASKEIDSLQLMKREQGGAEEAKFLTFHGN